VQLQVSQIQASTDTASRLQITLSPYDGPPDFSRLHRPASIDPVSVADLLRNGFVYPPHSIFEEVKLATFGFDPRDDMHDAPEFRFGFRDIGKRALPDDTGTDWVAAYRRELCEAVDRTCAGMSSPWLLQSGGKDSTALAMAAAEVRPDMTCLTYKGGMEEDELASAQRVARTLGLRHEFLGCDPGRAYDRYLAAIDRMPLLTADFALLSYVDLATAIAGAGGDGIVDGMGSDNYFGIPVERRQRILGWLARGARLPAAITELPLLERSFWTCYLLSTLQMAPAEREFPGSRFSDTEVDALLGHEIASRSRARLEPFRHELATAGSRDEHFAIAITVAGSGGGFAKGMYTAEALSLQVAYPHCDARLSDWVYRCVPSELLLDPATRTSKVLMRRYIATRFKDLPYVARKGSFRFALCGLARHRFDQVHAVAEQVRDTVPGAVAWLERNRRRFDNKYHASKFYLLAVVLPWLQARARG
jgi:hypothetical protein